MSSIRKSENGKIKNKFEFALFVPPKVDDKRLNLEKLRGMLGKEIQYYSRGRHAIFHILKSLNRSGIVVTSAFVCASIKEVVTKAGYEYCTCDINQYDLNIDLDSFKRLCVKKKVTCVIVPSLYGNPADLIEFYKYCKKNQIIMIDDGAQSFGAKLDGKYISTFGDAGLFSFAPGKSTTAAMGCLAWNSFGIREHVHTHGFIHKILYVNYNLNRLDAYTRHFHPWKIFLKYFSLLLENSFDISDDGCCAFEWDKMGGSINALISGGLEFRKKYWYQFKDRFKDNPLFYVVKSLRGNPVYIKIVIVMNHAEIADCFSDYLRKHGIVTGRGYRVEGQIEDLPIASEISGRVVELPIEDNEEKMEYLFHCVEEFIWEET